MPKRPLEQVPSDMKALVLYGKEDLRFEIRPVELPHAGEVLLKVGSVGVCGSDKHFYLDGRASSESVRQPVVLGHEFGGTIVAVGDGVAPGRIGERVSVEPLMPDWRSEVARRGRYNIDPSQRFFGVPGTDGALQQFLRVPAVNAFGIPHSVSDDAAAMVEPISVSLNGTRKAKITAGTSVLITGGGPIGLFAAQLSFIQGASAVTLIEPNETRRAIARGYGCEVATGIDEVGQDYDVLIECTGADTVRHDGCLKIKPGGRVVFIGVGAQEASLPMAAVIEREVSIHGVMRYSFTWPTVIEALASQKIVPDSLVSRRLPMDRAIEAWTNPVATDVKTIIRVNPPN